MQVEAENSLAGAVKNQGILVTQPDDGLLGAFPPRNIADDTAEEHPFFRAPECQRELDWEFLSGVGQAYEFDGVAEDLGRSPLGEAHDTRIMRGAKPFRHHDGQRTSQDLLLGVPEHPLRRAVPANDMAVLVGQHDGIGGRLHQRPKSFFTGMQGLFHMFGPDSQTFHRDGPAKDGLELLGIIGFGQVRECAFGQGADGIFRCRVPGQNDHG